MRLQSLETVNGWYRYTFRTTYRNGWADILAICKILSEYHDVKGIITDAGEWTPDDLNRMAIPEAGHICLRGSNKVYDGQPFQYDIYNQTDGFLMFMPKPYVDSLKRSELELLTAEEKKHTFDKFADSIEINATAFKERRAGYDKLYKAFEFYKEHREDGSSMIFKDEKLLYECDMSKIF